MAGNKVDVIVNFKAQMGQLQSAFNKIKNIFNTPGASNQLGKAGIKLQEYLNQAEHSYDRLMTKLNTSDRSKSSLKGISTEYQKLETIIEKINGEASQLVGRQIQLFNPTDLSTITELDRRLKNFESDLNKTQNKTTSFTNKISSGWDKINNAINLLNMQAKTGTATFSERILTGEGGINKKIAEIEKLISEYEKLRTVAHTTSLDSDILKATNAYDTIIQKITELKTKMSVAGVKDNVFNNLQSNFTNILSATESLTKLRGEAEKARLELVNLYSNKGLNISQNASTAEFTQALDNFINKCNLGVEAEQKLREAIEQTNGVMAGSSKYQNTISQTFTQMTSWTEQMNQLQSYTAMFFNVYSVVNLVKRALSSAYDTVKDLDAAMTETAVVTDFTVSDMWEQLPKYTQEANKLGATIQGAYETLTLYYQQGLSENQAWDLGIETMKMARIAGMDYAEATDMMTAAIRGFNMELNATSAQHINDVYSELAAVTASDTQEIAEAMTRTASLASSTGMDFDTASVYLAEAIETTREAPENIGTALKTILARFQSLTKDPDTLDADTQEALEGETVSANIVEAALKSAGIAARDTNGEFRDTADIFLELNEKWDSLDLMTQRYIATQAAGARQQSRFIAMMQNWSRTKELLADAQNSEGASQKQFEKTLVSMEALTNRLQNSWNQFTMGITNSNVIKAGTKILTGFLDVLNSISGVFGDSAFGQGFEAIAKIGMAFAAWQVLPKIIGVIFNHLTKDITIIEAEEVAMGAETESVASRMSAAYAKIIAAFKPVGAEAAAMAEEVTAANEAMAASAEATAAGTVGAEAGVATAGAAGTAGAASNIKKRGKLFKIADALGLLAFSRLGGNNGKGIIGKIGAFYGGGQGGKGFKATINDRKSKLPGWLNGKKASQNAQTAYYNRNISNVGLNASKVGTKIGALGKVGAGAAKAMSGLGTALSVIPFGPAAAAAGGLVAAGIAISKAYKSPTERMEEANKVLEDYQETSKQISTNKNTISSIEDEFKTLSRGIDNNGKNIGLTTKQYERYKEIVNELVKINPSLAKSYDENGQAIIDNATAIKEANKLLDEQEQRAIRKVTTDKNMNKILKGQQAVIDENNKELTASKNISPEWESGGISAVKAIEKANKGDTKFLNSLFKHNQNTIAKKNYQDYINEGLKEYFKGEKYTSGIDLSNITNQKLKDIVNSKDAILKAAQPLEDSAWEVDQSNYQALEDYFSKMEESYESNQDAINTVKDNLVSYLNRQDSEGKSLMDGIPSNVSDFLSTGLTALSEQALDQEWDSDELKAYTKDFAELLQELGDGSSEYTEALNQIQDAQDDFNDSSRNTKDITKYNDAIKGGTNALSRLADDYRVKGSEAEKALADTIDNQIALLKNYASETQATVQEALDPFGDLVDAAEGISESVEDTISNISDYSTAGDSIKEMLDDIFEGIDSEGNGSKKFWEAARQLMGQDVIDKLGTKEAVESQMKAIQSYFEEGEDGIANFTNAIWEHEDELTQLGVFKDGHLTGLTNSNLQQIAQVLDMNEQTLSALFEKGVQYGVTDWNNYKQLGTSIKDSDYSANIGKKGEKYTLASKEKFKAEAQENNQYQNPEVFAGLVTKTLDANKNLSFYSVDRYKSEGRDIGVKDLAKELKAFKGDVLQSGAFDSGLINKFGESSTNIGEAYKTFAEKGTQIDFGDNQNLAKSYDDLVTAMKSEDENKINDAYDEFFQQLSHQLSTETETEEQDTDTQKLQNSAQSLVSALDANTMALGGIPASLSTIGNEQLTENSQILEKGKLEAEETQTYKENNETLDATIKDLNTQLETAQSKGNLALAKQLKGRIKTLTETKEANDKKYAEITGFKVDGTPATKTTATSSEKIENASAKQKVWASQQEDLADVTTSAMSKVFKNGGFKEMLNDSSLTTTDAIKEKYGLKGKYADYNAEQLLQFITNNKPKEKTKSDKEKDISSESKETNKKGKDTESKGTNKKEEKISEVSQPRSKPEVGYKGKYLKEHGYTMGGGGGAHGGWHKSSTEEQTQYGNIDLNNRNPIKWNDKTLEQYKSALMSWNKDSSWKDIKAQYNGMTSTVLGGYGEYGKNSTEIAYSPIQQTKNGAQLLSSDQVNAYIGNLVAKLEQNNQSWGLNDLLKLDTKGLIADVGESAPQTSTQMHDVEAKKYNPEEEEKTSTPIIDWFRNLFSGFDLSSLLPIDVAYGAETSTASTKKINKQEPSDAYKDYQKYASMEKTGDYKTDLDNLNKMYAAYSKLTTKEKERVDLTKQASNNNKDQVTSTGKISKNTEKTTKETKKQSKNTSSKKGKTQEVKTKVDTKGTSKQVEKAVKKGAQTEVKANVDTKGLSSETSKSLEKSSGSKVKIQADTSEVTKQLKSLKGLKKTVKLVPNTDALKNVQVPVAHGAVNYNKLTGKQKQPKVGKAGINYNKVINQAQPGTGKASIKYTGGNATLTVHVKGKKARGQNLSGAAAFGSAAKGARRGRLGPTGKGGATLTGELGQELVWEPDSSSSYLVGTEGPEIVDLPQNAVVWPANETKKILEGEKHQEYTSGSAAKGTLFGSAFDFNANKYRVSTKTGTGNVNTSSTSTSKGSGKSKSKKKKKNKSDGWENEYDKYYNLQKKITKEIRIREQLEKEYDRLLIQRNSSMKDLTENVTKKISTLYDTITDAQSMMEKKNAQAEKKEAKKVRSGVTYKKNNKKGKYIKDENGNYKKASKKELKNSKITKYSRNKKSGGVETKLSNYAVWDEESHTVQINYDNLQALEKKSKKSKYWAKIGDKVDKYIDQLEEYQDAFEEAEDAFEEAVTELVEMENEAWGSIADLDGQIRDAIVDLRQQEIDKLTDVNDSINSANDRILNSINKAVDKVRRDRDNADTEEDIAEKERRLAYLKQDSSGANALEIKQLEEEIKDAKQDYQDELVDQAIEDFETSNEEAAEQRERMIELLEDKLDADQMNGIINSMIEKLKMESIVDGEFTEDSNLGKLFKSTTEYLQGTESEREKYFRDVLQAVKEAFVAQTTTLPQLAVQSALTTSKQNGGTPTNIEGATSSTGTAAGVQAVSGASGDYLLQNGKAYATDALTQGADGSWNLDTSQTYQRTGADMGQDGTVDDEHFGFVTADGQQRWGQLDTKNNTIKVGNTTYKDIKEVGDGESSSITSSTKTFGNGKAPWDYTSTGKMWKGNTYKRIASAEYLYRDLGLISKVSGKLDNVKTFTNNAKKAGLNVKYGSAKKNKGDKNKTRYVKGASYLNQFKTLNGKGIGNDGKVYKTGGLADYTGPAWLDGTPTKPEMVLNAQDTSNFIQLKDILADILKSDGISSSSTANTTSTNDVYNISVNVDQVANDYDVSKLAEQLKKEITKSSKYRNVNQVSRLR